MVDQTFCDSDPSKAVEIVEEHGSFLLVRTASGFAVIESGNGGIYPISPSECEGVPMTGEAIAMLLVTKGISPMTRRGGSLTSSANGVNALPSPFDRAGVGAKFRSYGSYDRGRPMPLLEELKAKACALLGRAMSSSSRTEGRFCHKVMG
jgi:hypothetical protein